MANFRINGNVTGSIVSNQVNNVQLTNNSPGTENQMFEKYIEEIKANFEQYLIKIATTEMNQEEKNSIIMALQDIKEQISQPQLDREKIKQSGTILEKSSYAASICGAVFSFLQLFK
ncbi:Na+/phosphate symporter [Croceifilum oryzae]|uniref:Na+/phosphate symporter n=1 Tax=Croceifilum oryzae TaxID=1553429 RepID=A0AAJ1WSU8_9BACL|nr:hypothetical protein [Croceifilum oryzae]MDQ0416321.1 Na+/phosphate symporter [Croceifilum oryzae]